MDSIEETKKDLVHFAECAVAGDADGARVYAMCRVRDLMKRDEGGVERADCARGRAVLPAGH
jgi:hypothetical protein